MTTAHRNDMVVSKSNSPAVVGKRSHVVVTSASKSTKPRQPDNEIVDEGVDTGGQVRSRRHGVLPGVNESPENVSGRGNVLKDGTTQKGIPVVTVPSIDDIESGPEKVARNTTIPVTVISRDAIVTDSKQVSSHDVPVVRVGVNTNGRTIDASTIHLGGTKLAKSNAAGNGKRKRGAVDRAGLELFHLLNRSSFVLRKVQPVHA
jgi:hypothetical protein